ncbi:Uma2 family endonuclease [Nocardia sp. BSTN01]|uniref:Uma2 family endonuclease n=1 Tax=Nocardia sp. BSTN01 TaxID=2783665 RepID=UPI00188E3DD0|nr:Uma2 family endonuclease [Nocardia sp. BSTN01]MBF5001271.1 Uma2 family endonuclease [Nocardia sp. BSTN01]
MLSQFPDRLLTLTDWNALPEDNARYYELVDGVVVAVPRPPGRHQQAVWRLADQLEPQLPHAYCVVAQAELVITPGPVPTVRVPDLMGR